MVPHLGPRSPAQRVENVFALLACLSGTKCSPMLASVRPPDVAAGEPQAILDLVTQVYYSFLGVHAHLQSLFYLSL